MLTSDFKEFVALFNSNRVDYLVVGAATREKAGKVNMGINFID